MKKILLVLLGASILLANETVVDTTGLEWQDNQEAKTVKKSWQKAKAYCQELELSSKSDWRLPTIKELQTIVDVKRYKSAIKRSFSNVSSSYYWSSSVDVSNSSLAWNVNFNLGDTTNYSKSFIYYVRCVRGRQ